MDTPQLQVALTGSNNEINERGKKRRHDELVDEHPAGGAFPRRVRRVTWQDEQTSKTAAVCQFLIRNLFPPDSSGTALVTQGNQLMNERNFLIGVVFVSYKLLLPLAFIRTSTDKTNRGVIEAVYARECETTARKLTEPLLNKPTISNVPDNSMGIRAGKAYAAKLLALLNELSDMGRTASTNRITYDARMDFERHLILWWEWCVAYSHPVEGRARLLHHLRTVAIPMMFDLELERPTSPAARMMRENYCDILHELGGAPVTLVDVMILHDTAYYSGRQTLRAGRYEGFHLPLA